ncbi:MAG: PhoH family protein [Candidatus Heimdallarchaeota archaeon]
MKNGKKPSIKRDELQKITLTDKQLKLYKTIRENTITFVQGPAGSSKTFTACYTALTLLAEKKVNQIILVKPIKESGNENLGALPGDINDKIRPYLESFVTNFHKIIGKQSTEFMFSTNEILFRALAYMRGTGYDRALIFVDEAQNMDYKSLMLVISRLGFESKMIIAGDVSQYDIKKNVVALPNFIELIKDLKGIASFEFKKEDIVRNRILIEITDRYEKWKYENNL